jgi:predicted ABC-type ATPase
MVKEDTPQPRVVVIAGPNGAGKTTCAAALLPDDLDIRQFIYVWLSSPDLAVQRVASRIQRGGHSVPEAVVQRRYWRGLANFIRLYQPLADTWIMCDNSGDSPVIVARGERDAAPVVSDQELYHEIQRAVVRAEQKE